VKGKDDYSIRVVCTVQYTIGGRLTGLTSTDPVVLQQGGGGARDPLSLTQNGAFTFPTPVPAGSQYQVTVTTQPKGQICTVIDGTGTVTNVPITSVLVSCV